MRDRCRGASVRQIMETHDARTLGQITYEAYCDALMGRCEADWLTVEPAAKIAWEYAARTVIQSWLVEGHLDRIERP
jgi:hypothetical protein